SASLLIRTHTHLRHTPFAAGARAPVNLCTHLTPSLPI
ncbi:uncharacterized protein METZ01_LOCUS217246, partial [marine metagenome]